MDVVSDRKADRDDAATDAGKWGIAFDPALVEGAHGEAVWAENVAAVTAFLVSTTQWRCVALANGRIRTLGLDYAGVRAGLEMGAVAMTAQLWCDLRVVENGAVAEMNGAGR